MIGNSNDETNFLHKLLLTDTKVSKTCEAFTNGSSANIKFLKIHLSKMIESGGGIIPIELFYPFKMINKGFKKVQDSSKNKNEIIDLAKTFDNSVRGNKNFFGTGITLTDNEIKDIVKII